jgi:hypothetical protein
MIMINWFLLILLSWSLLPAPGWAQSPSSGQAGASVFGVSVSGSSFNPSRGDKVTLAYSLSSPATVTVKVFDADADLVRVVANQVRQNAGAQTAAWDGRDADGKTVPNEAYFFTIEARTANGGETVYDPVTFSGGEPFDLGKAQVSREAGTLTYRLSQPSRVLVRIGVPGSSLLRTLVDWQPRSQGEITEYWNGKDQDNLINIVDSPNYTVLIAYYTLPETSVITVGNSVTDYRTYKSQLRGKRPAKPVRPMTNARKLSPQFMARSSTFRDFKVAISFPEVDKGDPRAVPTVRDKVLVRVDIPEADREVIAGRQYEIILFVDTTYFAEEERGYVPFNFPWELTRLPPGEHTFTVNIVTFDGQIGIGSRRIRVMR